MGISLSVKSQHLSLGTDEVKEQDAAMAASDLDEKFKLEPKWKWYWCLGTSRGDHVI